jgi:hypothetical protein
MSFRFLTIVILTEAGIQYFPVVILSPSNEGRRVRNLHIVILSEAKNPYHLLNRRILQSSVRRRTPSE